MQIVIDIPENEYKFLLFHAEQAEEVNASLSVAKRYILNGIPLPKGHGRLIDADKCIMQAWNDFYKHEEEREKKDTDYIGVKRLHDQNGFECCLTTICESPTVIESED